MKKIFSFFFSFLFGYSLKIRYFCKKECDYNLYSHYKYYSHYRYYELKITALWQTLILNSKRTR